MIEAIETYQRVGHSDFTTKVVGGKVVVEVLHQRPIHVKPERRNPKCGCPKYLLNSMTAAYTVPEQYRVVIRDSEGFIVWQDRRRFLDYGKALDAAIRKAARGKGGAA